MIKFMRLATKKNITLLFTILILVPCHIQKVIIERKSILVHLESMG